MATEGVDAWGQGHIPVTLMIASVLRREKRCTERVQAHTDMLKRFARLRYPLCRPPLLTTTLSSHLTLWERPVGDHRAKRSACLERLLGAGAW